MSLGAIPQPSTKGTPGVNLWTSTTDALLSPGGWDSHHCRLLKTRNLTELDFRMIREIRRKGLVETRIEHADLELPIPKSSTA